MATRKLLDISTLWFIVCIAIDFNVETVVINDHREDVTKISKQQLEANKLDLALRSEL